MNLQLKSRRPRLVSGFAGLAIAALLTPASGCGDKAPKAQADAGAAPPPAATAPANGKQALKGAAARRTRGPKVKVEEEPEYNNVVERRQARAKAKQSGAQ